MVCSHLYFGSLPDVADDWSQLCSFFLDSNKTGLNKRTYETGFIYMENIKLFCKVDTRGDLILKNYTLINNDIY